MKFNFQQYPTETGDFTPMGYEFAHRIGANF
jgi:hypothetical protein